jgi:Signal transduction histidine kinase
MIFSLKPDVRSREAEAPHRKPRWPLATVALVRRPAERRPVVLGAAALIFVLVFVLSQHSLNVSEATGLLYVVPIALVGLELGLGAGLGAAAGALALLGIWMVTGHPGLDGVGFATRALAMVSVGGLAGRFSDRVRASLRRQETLLESGLDLARLGNIEAMPGTLAEQVRRAVNVAAVRVALADVPAVASGQPAGESLTIPIASRGIDFGTLEVSAGAGRSFSPEERLVLETLALQGATAAHNQRLLAVEREQAALHSELEHTRQHISNQLRSADHILDHHEEERREIARQLHEQVAQTVAAALIALSLVEHDVGDALLDRSQIEAMRRHMRDCLEDLRRLADSLRPVLLDEFGLLPALERVCAEESERTSRSIAFHADGPVERLPAGVDISVYRNVDEVLKALDGATDVRVSVVDEQGRLLRIVIDSSSSEQDEREVQEKLATARARLELLGGALRTNSRPPEGTSTSTITVVAEIPLRD